MTLKLIRERGKLPLTQSSTFLLPLGQQCLTVNLSRRPQTFATHPYSAYLFHRAMVCTNRILDG